MTENTPDWTALTEAMETMAKAVGAHAVLKDKYGSLRVEFLNRSGFAGGSNS